MKCSVALSGRAETRAARPGVCLVIFISALSLSACAAATHAGAAKSASGSLESYIRRVRALSAESNRQPAPSVPTVESWDPRLSGALLALAIYPTSDQHRRVALEYRRLKILDRAYSHLDEAVRLDPEDAAAFDGRARIWRDWGLPSQGLADAERAVRLAPQSAAAANTLGTLLQALGNVNEAHKWYERSLKLDPTAAFAMNNLCYASITARRDGALDICQRAVAMAPHSRDARNNLALAHAAKGDFARAQQELEISTDAAISQYNVGILYMADRQYGKAISAFESAARLKPHFEHAEARAQQARALVRSMNRDSDEKHSIVPTIPGTNDDAP
jgi:tetratricopeptide (TPR) repeat protein